MTAPVDQVEAVARAISSAMRTPADGWIQYRFVARAAIAAMPARPDAEVGELIGRLRAMGPRPDDGGQTRHDRSLYVEAADALAALHPPASNASGAVSSGLSSGLSSGFVELPASDALVVPREGEA